MPGVFTQGSSAAFSALCRTQGLWWNMAPAKQRFDSAENGKQYIRGLAWKKARLGTPEFGR